MFCTYKQGGGAMSVNAQVKVEGDTFLCLEMAKAAINYFQASNIKRATIDRYEGLTLFGEADRILFHASGLICGFSGTGPDGSIETLRYAGFGLHARLVRTNPQITLDK
jgi:hypothetical protein